MLLVVLLVAFTIAVAFITERVQAHHIAPDWDRIGFMVDDKKMLFDPKPDITTHELALCMDVLLSTMAGPRYSDLGFQVAVHKFKKLPPNVSRHFVLDPK